MNTSRFGRKWLWSVYLLVVAALVLMQTQIGSGEYNPKVGQQGKDVVWIPTAQSLVDKMLDLAEVTARDYVIDLGSGDGRTVISAAKRGARALGIEYNGEMVVLAKRNAEAEGVGDKVDFVQADLFQTDFSKASVVTMFLLPDINRKLRPQILDLKPGTRIVSNTFDMGEWEADQKVVAEKDCSSYCTAYLWIVPARVDGTWMLPQGELRLTQSFQMISGTLKKGLNEVPLTGKLNGNQISFTAGDVKYVGQVSGDAMEGTYRMRRTVAAWRADRIGRVIRASGQSLTVSSGRSPYGRVMMKEPERISARETHEKVRSGKALLVCAYEDEVRCSRMKLEGAIFLKELEDRGPFLPKDREIVFY